MIARQARFIIRGPFGERILRGWRIGEWATYRLPERPDLWVLTLLPVGMTLPLEWSSFVSLDRALAAVAEIQRSRNSWSIISQADFTLSLRDRLRAICLAHGAVRGPATFAGDADRRMNGYG